MKQNNAFFRRIVRAAALTLAFASSVAAGAQTAVQAPANLKADAEYNLVKLTWQRPGTTDTLLAEGFEGDKFPPEGWTVKTTNTNDPYFTWFGYPTDDIKENVEDYSTLIHGGSRSAVVYMDMNAPYDDGTPATQDEWLIAPAVKGARYLNFYSWIDPMVKEYGQNAEFGDHYYVKVSHDGGSTWTVLWDARYDSDGKAGWQAVSLYLGDETRGDVIVAFEAQSNTANKDESLYFTWGIDDVSFTAQNGAEGLPAESYNVYLDGKVMAQNVKSLSYTDETEKTPGKHVYKVTGYNETGKTESEAAVAEVDIKQPGTNAPRNVDLSYSYDEKSGKYSVKMTWEAPEGDRKPAYYNAYCNNALIGSWLDGFSIEQTGLAKGVYNYSVTAVYQYPDGESEEVGDQIALGTRYPARNITTKRNDDGSLTLSWTAPKTSDVDVKNYLVFRGNEKLSEQTETSFTETNSPQGLYDYSVKAVYTDGVESTPLVAQVEYGDVPTYDLPFEENFTGGMKPGNWRVEKLRDGLKDNYLWRFDNWYELPVSGNGFDKDFASVNCSSAGYTSVFTGLYTPPLKRTAIGDTERTYLDFDMDYEIDNGTAIASHAYLVYSTDNGENWTQLTELKGYLPDDLAEGQTCLPQHESYDVTEAFEQGGDVIFGWEYKSKNSQHLCIDNVHIFNADPSGIESVDNDNATAVSVEGNLIVIGNDKGRVKTATLFTTDGTQVANITALKTGSLKLTAPDKGLYLLRLTTVKGTQTVKVCVK